MERKNDMIKLRVTISGSYVPQIKEIAHYLKRDNIVGIFGLKDINNYIKKLKQLNIICQTDKIIDNYDNNNIIGYKFYKK